jgi:hypothetical protein
MAMLACPFLCMTVDADEKEKKDPAAKKQVAVNVWKSLFNGKDLGQWKPVTKYDFKEHGKIEVKDGTLIYHEGQAASGVRWTGEFPKMNYELTLEAQRVKGSDFFCGLTFPFKDNGLTLIMGGWGGGVVGLSCIDGYYAIDNETAQYKEFKNGEWYHVRVRATEKRIDVFLDDEHLIELEPADRKLEVSWEMEPCLPLGLASWYTTGAVRNIRYRLLEDVPAEKP